MPKAARIVSKINSPKDFNKALKSWRMKSRELTNEIRDRRYHEKPAAKRRKKLNKAKYIQSLRSRQDD